MPLVLLLLVLLCSPAVAEPLLKPHDVLALVGGEDMAALAESGYLEWQLAVAQPEAEVQVRSLAWEGDTVFTQARELNYPELAAQLQEIGATVVIAQFGQAEALSGQTSASTFTAAYETLLKKLGEGRRVVVVAPTVPKQGAAGVVAYTKAVEEMAQRNGWRFVAALQQRPSERDLWRDGLHLAAAGLVELGSQIFEQLQERPGRALLTTDQGNQWELLKLIRAKNRYWFHYSRPQNWAFLNGDRVNQPSSRDHRDPSKRWFPEEMQQWLPLIATKEREIWTLARRNALP